MVIEFSLSVQEMGVAVSICLKHGRFYDGENSKRFLRGVIRISSLVDSRNDLLRTFCCPDLVDALRQHQRHQRDAVAGMQDVLLRQMQKRGE